MLVTDDAAAASATSRSESCSPCAWQLHRSTCMHLSSSCEDAKLDALVYSEVCPGVSDDVLEQAKRALRGGEDLSPVAKYPPSVTPDT
ncbi:hypothetical protein B0H10DRAFT_2224721 [Mycena sp. CBHHK59/15]|nr:hypothetical protein B0H10DRAFT_2224721 [Mycena sp. CBHHK59/15]